MKKVAIDENSPSPFHHNRLPIPYPNTAPIAEPKEQIKTNLKELDLDPRHKAISKISGGIGKKDASVNERMNKAAEPHFESDHPKTQL